MKLGLDSLSEYLSEYHRNEKVGLLCHAASFTSSGQHAINLLENEPAIELSTIFGPEHGVTGVAADMEEVATSRTKNGTPIFSLYGSSRDTLTPTSEMLSELDLLVIDLQDIGTRYYTYIYTMAFCLQACAKARVPVVICDRPNPLGGIKIEGNLQTDGFDSFVGEFPLPVRHGMTIGEMARYLNEEHQIGASIFVVEMCGWERKWLWNETKLTWFNPSPNMRSPHAALLYPGACLLEACNISEGRGTSSPFELCGAPWIDAEKLMHDLSALKLPGIEITPTNFTPDSRKFAGEECFGARLQITDPENFQAYQFGVALLSAFYNNNPESFAWRTPLGNPPHKGFDAGPYEFNLIHPAIDLLTGSCQIRESINNGNSWANLQKICATNIPLNFQNSRAQALLY